jgi:methyl-accepting chemotaxis protein
MSSTSEELAAQAEQLQSAISFFKVDAGGSHHRPVHTPIKRGLPAPSAFPRAKAPPAASRMKVGPSVADQQARAKGFALDLSMGGPDHEDIEFKESA